MANRWAPLAALFLAAGAQAQDAEPARFSRLVAEITDLVEPGGAAIDDVGRIFVSETGGDRISVHDATGRRLNTWGAIGSAPGSLSRPGGLAIGPDGLVYVADTGNDRVQVFTPEGQLVRHWGERGAPPGRLAAPRGIDVDDRHVYVADTDNGRVQVFDHHGALEQVHVSGLHHDDGLVRPIGVAVDAGGMIYVTDADRDFIKVFGLARVRKHWGAWGDAPGLFAEPHGMAHHEGRLFVADTRNDSVQVFAVDGTPAYRWGDDGGGGLHHPTDVAIAPSGRFAVVVEAIENRCRIFEAIDGAPPARRRPRRGAHLGRRLAADGDLLAVHDEETETIAVLDLSGDAPVRIADLGGRGRGTGQLLRPGGMVLDADSGEVVVADTANERIQVFRIRRDAAGAPRYDALAARFVRSIDPGSRLRAASASLTWPVRPVDIARGDDGRWYVLDARNAAVLVFDARFAFIESWGSTGEGALRRPTDLAIDSTSGRLHVVDEGNQCVQTFDLAGALLRTQAFERPFGVAAGEDGVIYVTSAGGRRVESVDAEGHVANRASNLGAATGVAADRRGRVLVADHGRQQVCVFDPDARLAVFIGLWPAEDDPQNPPAVPARADDAWHTMTSNDGTYRVQWTPSRQPIPLNDRFSVTVKISDARDPARIVERPLLQVHAAMPHHRHGLLERPVLRRGAGGAFVCEDMLLHMPGYWELYVDITEAGITERAQSELHIE